MHHSLYPTSPNHLGLTAISVARLSRACVASGAAHRQQQIGKATASADHSARSGLNGGHVRPHVELAVRRHSASRTGEMDRPRFGWRPHHHNIIAHVTPALTLARADNSAAAPLEKPHYARTQTGAEVSRSNGGKSSSAYNTQRHSSGPIANSTRPVAN